MKKTLLILLAVVAFGCQQSKNEDDRSSEANQNMEEYSGENVSPQLEDSVDRFEVDTVSSSSSAAEQSQGELNNQSDMNSQRQMGSETERDQTDPRNE